MNSRALPQGGTDSQGEGDRLLIPQGGTATGMATRTYRKTDRRFMRLLHGRRDAAGRKMTVASLAALIGSNRCHVNKVLLGQAGRGFYTRRKLARFLTNGEMEALGWEKELFHIEHSSAECPASAGRSAE
jgi:hypothetical protein